MIGSSRGVKNAASATSPVRKMGTSLFLKRKTKKNTIEETASSATTGPVPGLLGRKRKGTGPAGKLVVRYVRPTEAKGGWAGGRLGGAGRRLGAGVSDRRGFRLRVS